MNSLSFKSTNYQVIGVPLRLFKYCRKHYSKPFVHTLSEGSEACVLVTCRNTDHRPGHWLAVSYCMAAPYLQLLHKTSPSSVTEHYAMLSPAHKDGCTLICPIRWHVYVSIKHDLFN